MPCFPCRLCALHVYIWSSAHIVSNTIKSHSSELVHSFTKNRQKTIGSGPIDIPITTSITIVPPEMTTKVTLTEPVQQAKKRKKASKPRQLASKSRQLIQEEQAKSSQKAEIMADGVTSRYGRKIRQTEKGRGGSY